MGQLDHVKSLIVVFVMPGCPACEDYKPRFEAMANHWMQQGAPMFWYQGGAIPRGQIPVLVLNAASRDPSVTSLADQYAVEGVPATLLLTKNARPVKREGAMPDEEIHELLSSAYYANR